MDVCGSRRAASLGRALADAPEAAIQASRRLMGIPRGKVEPGETPGDALIRELREELGITVPRSAIRPASFADGGLEVAQGGIVILLYTVREWTGTPQALEDGAHIDWFLSYEIDRLPRPPLDIALCSAMFPESGGIGPV